ncbi:response regulator [bacterium]|nr:response regulator [bacterium]
MSGLMNDSEAAFSQPGQAVDCQLLLEQLPYGICVVDNDLMVKVWNPQLAEWTGWSSESVIGQSLTNLFPSLHHRGTLQRLESVLSTGVPALFSAAMHQQLLPIPHTAAINSRGMVQEVRAIRISTEPRQMLIMVSDITLTTTQKEQLRQERKNLLEAQTSLQASIEELGRKNARLQQEIDERQEAEIAMRQQTAALIHAKVRESEHTKRLEQLVCDLTKARQAAEVAARTKSEFLANMSHEIRTPMTAILGYVDLLANETFTEDERAEHIASIRRNSHVLTEIIDDILDISKIEAGKMQVESLPFSPREVVAEVVEMLQDRANVKGLHLDMRLIEPAPTRLVSDPTRIRQILINLVGNAIKFTKAGSVHVVVQWIAAHSSHGKLQIQVVDTGIGIPHTARDQLFAPFVQADTRMTREYGGTGLGLAISQRLARMLGGELSVDSDVGRGSTFTLELPCPGESIPMMPELPASSQTNRQADMQAPLTDTKILVVDDTPDNRKLLSFHLKKAGADVDLAENGQEALEKIQAARSSQPFDIILMDMQMPVLDGYDATQQLRRIGDLTPVIAVTAHAMAGDRDKCLSVGCNDYITKPAPREKLLAIVVQWLQSSVALTGQ